jgi:hypothetical protein
MSTTPLGHMVGLLNEILPVCEQLGMAQLQPLLRYGT